jgi:hypothetical protein
MSRLSVARKELGRASDALAALRVAKSPQVFDECWVNILRYLERCWNKTQAAMKHLSKWQGWPGRGRIIDLRKTDPLLSYLCNARGVEEHGIAAITAKKPGSISIGGLRRPGTTVIENLIFRNGHLELKSDRPLPVTIQPSTIVLVPVVNRNVTYAVPTSHDGTPLTGNDPVTVATAGIAFYTRCLELIELEFPG